MFDKKYNIVIIILILIVLFILTNYLKESVFMNQEDIKEMEVNNLFYPSNSLILKQQMNDFFNSADIDYNSEKIKGLIVPHAGIKFSGQTAMFAYKKLYFSLLFSDIDKYKVIILSPAHRVYFNDIKTISNDFNFYKTPFGDIKISKDLEQFSDKNAFDSEHSIEVQLPFLKYIFDKANKDFEITPILIGDVNSEYVFKKINHLIDNNTIVIASSDLSHFLEKDIANKKDKESINNILNNKENIDACGKIPILTLNKIAKENNWNKEFLDYSDSSNVTKDKESVVGYSSFSYFTKENTNFLISISKLSIKNKLFNKNIDFKDLESIIPKEYKEQKATFVTINKNKELRGCIGEIYPKQEIYKSVIDNSINAAFNDPRFEPLKKQEFKDITIEISILSKPKEVSLDKINKGNGVIIKKGFNQAVFLPQVWDQLPDKDLFLSNLCQKAGLDSNCYKNKDIDFYKFDVKKID